MSKFPHDDFAKAYLKELLSTIGKATPNRAFRAETRTADLWFELKSKSQSPQLGLIGRLLTKNALIEVFRNPATAIEIRACKHKLFSEEGEIVRKATKHRKTPAEQDLPLLLLLMPTASDDIRAGFAATPTDTPGVYEFPRLDRTILVVLHQLPKTEDTLWLRLLSRSGEQRRAMEEFAELTTEVPLYGTISDLLADYRAILESRGTLTLDEEELIMNLSAAYLKKQEEWKQEGRQEGRQEERYVIACNLLREGVSIELIMKVTRFTADEIEAIRITL